MKILAVIAFCLFSTAAAFAADPVPKPASPSCGKTAEECQKVVDGLKTQLSQAALMVQGLRTQRNIAQNAKDEGELNTFVQQQKAAAAPALK